ncbi:MAG: MFS transporter [Opitutaceae bacterium]|nr:MFS transporter [Opitutaceae bacterium]
MSAPIHAAPPGTLLPPHWRRWVIVALVFLAFVLNYVDRQIVSVLKPTLKAEFAIDDRGYALLVNVFTFCYASTYAGAGWLADRFGAGRMILGGLIAWSSACLLTGFSRTLGQLTFLRGLLGMSETALFPSQLRVVTEWFPPGLRATANSICAAGSTLGAVVAAPLVAWLAISHSWQAAFVVPGALGLVLAAVWWVVYRAAPAGADGAAPGAEAMPAFTWPKLWRTRSLWGVLLCRFFGDPVWYFCLFWMPGYLQEQSGLTLAQIGLLGWIPFLVADVGGVGSSVFSDRLVRRGAAPLRARKYMLAGVSLLTPLCVLIPQLSHPAPVLGLFSVVGMVCLSWLFNLGVVVAEAFPKPNVGSVWGIAGACGAAGAIVFNTYVGQVMETLGPVRVFAVMALLHPVAALVLWTMVRKERPDIAGAPVPA